MLALSMRNATNLPRIFFVTSACLNLITCPFPDHSADEAEDSGRIIDFARKNSQYPSYSSSYYKPHNYYYSAPQIPEPHTHLTLASQGYDHAPGPQYKPHNYYYSAPQIPEPHTHLTLASQGYDHAPGPQYKPHNYYYSAPQIPEPHTHLTLASQGYDHAPGPQYKPHNYYYSAPQIPEPHTHLTLASQGYDHAPGPQYAHEPQERSEAWGVLNNAFNSVPSSSSGATLKLISLVDKTDAAPEVYRMIAFSNFPLCSKTLPPFFHSFITNDQVLKVVKDSINKSDLSITITSLTLQEIEERSLQMAYNLQLRNFYTSLCLKSIAFLTYIHPTVDQSIEEELKEMLKWFKLPKLFYAESEFQRWSLIKDEIYSHFEMERNDARSFSTFTTEIRKHNVEECKTREAKIIIQILACYYQTTNMTKWRGIFEQDRLFVTFYMGIGQHASDQTAYKQWKEHWCLLRIDNSLPWKNTTQMKVLRNQRHSALLDFDGYDDDSTMVKSFEQAKSTYEESQKYLRTMGNLDYYYNNRLT